MLCRAKQGLKDYLLEYQFCILGSKLCHEAHEEGGRDASMAVLHAPDEAWHEDFEANTSQGVDLGIKKDL